MTKLVSRFCNSTHRGTVTFDAKHDEKFYKKNWISHWDFTGCSEEVAIKDFRYINWSDKTGFLRAKVNDITNLSRKRPRIWGNDPTGFDHTSFWRRPGDKFPLFCLTEPYKDTTINEEYILKEEENLINKHNLSFKIIQPSQKSLWYPDSTFMIFWWNPNYFDFEEHEQILFSHEDAIDFEKKCKINKFERK